MSLTEKDIEVVEKIVYKNADDVAVSIARSFERLEERVDALEARVSARVADLEDKMEGVRQDLSDELGDVKEELREMSRMREHAEMV